MADLAGSKRQSSTSEVDLTRKKGKKHGRRAAQTQDNVEAGAGDYVRVIPVSATADDAVGSAVLLSSKDKATGLELSADRLSVTGWKGFRSVRATHGFHEGTYYCEVTVQHLGATGHCRIGWSTKEAEINAPVGYDQHSFGYRDLEGSKVHKAERQEYGKPYGEGDVLGLFLHLPAGGRALETRPGADLVRYKGALYQMQQQQPEATKPLQGSVLAFTCNGVLQGAAFQDISEGTYYPCASLFSLPEQKEGATVSFNFGPDFKYGPPVVEGCPAAEPMSVLPAKQAAGAAAEEAALVGPAATVGSIPAAPTPAAITAAGDAATGDTAAPAAAGESGAGAGSSNGPAAKQDDTAAGA